MKKLITLATVVLSLAAAGNALAHGAKPKHGGVVQSANDLTFEFVQTGAKVIIYVEDHGNPLSTAGTTGKLTVLNGTEKSEASLAPGGDNTLATNGDVKVGKRAKAIAAITFADKKTVNVRFLAK